MMFFKKSTNANTFINTGANKINAGNKTNTSLGNKTNNTANNKALQWKTKPLVVTAKK